MRCLCCCLSRAQNPARRRKEAPTARNWVSLCTNHVFAPFQHTSPKITARQIKPSSRCNSQRTATMVYVTLSISPPYHPPLTCMHPSNQTHPYSETPLPPHPQPTTTSPVPTA